MSSSNPASNINASTQFLQTKKETYAYRRFGMGSGLPLLCLQHFTGTGILRSRIHLPQGERSSCSKARVWDVPAGR